MRPAGVAAPLPLPLLLPLPLPLPLPLLLLLLLLVSALSGACGGGGGGDAMPATFSGPPRQSVDTTSGALRVDVRWSPSPPAPGVAAAELAVVDKNTGTAVPGLAVVVVPWMPAHGHGPSIQPMVTEQEPGVFVADPVYLIMPGSWQLRTTISGAVDDTATVPFEIP